MENHSSSRTLRSPWSTWSISTSGTERWQQKVCQVRPYIAKYTQEEADDLYGANAAGLPPVLDPG